MRNCDGLGRHWLPEAVSFLISPSPHPLTRQDDDSVATVYAAVSVSAV
jgi:hypothetical protein